MQTVCSLCNGKPTVLLANGDDYGKGNGNDYGNGMMRMMRMQHTALHSHNAMLLDNPRDIMNFCQIYMLSPVRGSSTYHRSAV